MAKSTKKSVGKDVMDLEAKSLAKRFEPVKSRASFAKQHGLNATMIQQHLSSERPISLDYAKKYARAFGCNLIDVSARLHDEILKANIFIENEVRKAGNGELIIQNQLELTKQERKLIAEFRKIKTEDGIKNILRQIEMVVAIQNKSPGSSATAIAERKEASK